MEKAISPNLLSLSRQMAELCGFAGLRLRISANSNPDHNHQASEAIDIKA
jgi:hypothetical protein